MFSVFGEVIKRFYISQHKVINVDNWVAKLHYRISFWLLLTCCTLVCSRQYIGDHIRCIVDDGIPTSVVNTYCFFTSTYTLLNNGPIGGNFRNRSAPPLYAHPGVSSYTKDATVLRHKYYQWIPFVLFGQALLFLIPHILWKNFEKGTIRDMVEGLQRVYLRSSNPKDNVSGRLINGYEIYSAKSVADVADRLNDQFLRRSRFHLNRYWSMKLIYCEILNLLNVCTQLYAMDAFLGGNFVDLGLRILKNDPRDNPFEIVFPKVTKCDFYKYGPSGSVQKYDAMCVMALNVINEKIYAVLWFWFVFLVPASLAVLLWRALSFVLHSKSERFNYHLLCASNGLRLNPSDLALVTKHFQYSDWLFMCYLGANVDAIIFREFLLRLSNELNEQLPSTSSSDLEDEKKSELPKSRKKLECQSMIALSSKENGIKSSKV